MKAARLHGYTEVPSSAFTIEEVDRPKAEARDDAIVEVSTDDVAEIDTIARGLHDGEVDGRAVFTP